MHIFAIIYVGIAVALLAYTVVADLQDPVYAPTSLRLMQLAACIFWLPLLVVLVGLLIFISIAPGEENGYD